MRDNRQLGLEWEAANYERAMELNDMLDACPDLIAKRTLYQTFTKEEQNGLMSEYCKRMENKRAPAGSLVMGVHSDKINGHSFHFCQRSGNSVMGGVHLGTALVLGQAGYGSHIRYVMLQPPWENREGHKVMFAEVQSCDLKVVT